MKKILAVFLLCLSFNSSAADEKINLVFDSIKLTELSRLIFSDLLKKSYLLSSDFVQDNYAVSLDLKGISHAEAEKMLLGLIQQQGYVVEQKRGYFSVSKPSSEPDLSVFFYRAKYRPISYIMDLTSSLFKTGKFSSQRGISSFQQQPLSSPAPVSSGPVNSQQRRPVQDTGTSAYSLQDKNEQDAFIFSGTDKEIAQLQKLLQQIDVQTGEVLVKGMVYEVTTGEKDGSAFSLALNLMQGKFGLNFGRSVTGDSITFKSASIDAVFSALSTDSRFKSVSNPSLRVKSGSNARFSVGSDVPVLGAVQFDKNGNPVQSVEYKPSGVIFDLKPQIRDSVIDLTINQQLSSFIPTTTGVNNSPTLIKREISTSIGAANDDVIVLGGLDEEKTSQDGSGLSFFPAWMKSRGGENSKTQILLVLQVQKI